MFLFFMFLHKNMGHRRVNHIAPLRHYLKVFFLFRAPAELYLHGSQILPNLALPIMSIKNIKISDGGEGGNELCEKESIYQPKMIKI